MDQLNVKEQQEFQLIVEQKQMKDFMRLYSNLVSRCFDDCVNDFTSANLTSKESSCIAKCSEKFLKHSERVGQRFQEQKYVNCLANVDVNLYTNHQRFVDAKLAEKVDYTWLSRDGYLIFGFLWPFVHIGHLLQYMNL